ncbi:MAG: helix-turn-helix transcriptional regulator [Acidiferrobacterales bacterium]
MSQRTHNYLRAHRKRAGFTQYELAVLLGCKDGANVSRYERLCRAPNLETAFACQAIFGVSAHELFPGIYQNVEHVIKKRAEQLTKKLGGMPPNAVREYKRRALNAIASPREVLSAQEV